MRKSLKTAASILIAASAAALAHDGVQNPAVKARMDGMERLAEHTKVLGNMAKGATGFDAEAARAAATALAEEAAQIPTLFEAPEDDPKSEASPTIWASFPEFTKRAATLSENATTLAGSVETLGDLRAGMSAIGGACSSCHKSFRE